MKFALCMSSILVSTTIMAAEPPQSTPTSHSARPVMYNMDLRQPILTAVILTTLSAEEIANLNEEQNNSKKKNPKPTKEKKHHNKKTYRPSQKNKPQGQKLSQYPGRYGGSQK